MQNPFNARAPAFDANAINDTIQRALTSAGLDTSAGPMHNVTETIRRALASAGLSSAPAPAASVEPVIDVVARVVDDEAAQGSGPRERPFTGETPAPGSFES